MNTLNSIDTKLFYVINNLRSPFLDYFFAFLSHNLSFIIALLAVVFFLGSKEYRKNWWILIVIIGLSFLLADRISVICFKDVFERLRPSHALENVHLVKMKSFELLYDNKGGLYGFVSSHSANAFALATVFALMGRKYKYFGLLVFLWAFLVGYSRVYCGVHYPGDVICGGILGILIGYLLYSLYKYISKRNPKFFSQK